MSWELTPGAGHSPGPGPAGHTPGYEGTNGGQNLYLVHFSPGQARLRLNVEQDVLQPRCQITQVLTFYTYNRNIGSDNCDIFQS